MAEEYFISYRRKSGGEVQARLIYDILSKKVGKEKVFYDKDHIVESRFAPQIEKALSEAKHFILLVNEAFVRIPPKPSFFQRLFNSKNTKKNNDWYYYEITYAIEHIGIDNITPILFDKGFSFKSLPKELEQFYCLDECQNIKYLSDFAEYFDEKIYKHFNIRDTSDKQYDSKYTQCYEALLKNEYPNIFEQKVESNGDDNITFATQGPVHIDKSVHYHNGTLEKGVTSYTETCNIKYNYMPPLKKDGHKKVFYGREDFVSNLHKKFVNGGNCINVVASGGMGKTSVAHKYINIYGNSFYGDRIIFVTSNKNIRDDFNSVLRKCISSRMIEYEQVLRQENDPELITSRIVEVLSKEEKKSLIVIDVNIDDQEARRGGLKALEELRKIGNQWHILYLSRTKIKYAEQYKEFELQTFEDDFDGASGLFGDIYKDNGFSKDQLKELFSLVYYHPLLIEQLAAYGVRGEERKTFEQLRNQVSKDKIKNHTTKRDNDEGIWLKDKQGNEYNVCNYLKELICYSDYSNNHKYILRHFVWWPYEYIPLRAIECLLQDDDNDIDIEELMIQLSDQMIFSKSNKGYRMHGVLGDVIKTNLELEKDIDYTRYTENVKSLLKSDTEIDKDTRSCIDSTPLSHFGIGETRDYVVYEDWLFLRRLAMLKVANTALSELSYKAQLLRTLYNLSGKEIYEKVFFEIKDQSSHITYYDWLDKQSGFDAKIPSDGMVKFNGADGREYSFKMIKVDGGAFKMGAQNTNKKGDNYDDEAYDRESPVHNVELSDFYIGETPVTQGLWKAVMGRDNNPSSFDKGNDYPVESVSWYDCLNFIIELNKKTGLKFRFPTEAQWEFAARGGNKHSPYKYSGGKNIEDVAVYWDNSQNDGDNHCSSPVKSKSPNELGIYDMSGNVIEWCQDWIGAYSGEPRYDPQGPSSGSSRVLRGGSWYYFAKYCRVSYRGIRNPDIRNCYYGMRLALPCWPFPS